MDPIRNLVASSSSDNVLDAACEALGRLGEKPAIDVLEDLTIHPVVGPTASLHYLRARHDNAFLARVLEERSTRGPVHQCVVALEFSRFWFWEESRSFLGSCLIEDKGPRVRLAAARALGRR